MRPIRDTFSMAAASANAICLSQKPTTGGALTLNGALATTEQNTSVWPSQSRTVAPLDAYRRVAIASTADDSARVFTLTYTDTAGTVRTETITGPDTTSVSSANSVVKVIGVTVDAATAGNITVGTNNQADTPWLPVSYNETPSQVALQAKFSSGASLTWQWQSTRSDPYDGGSASSKLASNEGSALTGSGVVEAEGGPVTMVRAHISSYSSGSVEYAVLQGSWI